jgi:hypothetical protein
MSDKKQPTPKYTPGENDAKLFNVIRIWDVYVFARAAEEAQACLDTWIRSENLTPSEATALPVTRDPEVRERWRNEKPLVANDITEEEFEEMAKGRTTIELYNLLFKKGTDSK